MNKVLSIDCDNILCDTARAFLEYYKLESWKEISYDAIHHPYLHKNKALSEIDLSREGYYQFFCRAHDTSSLQPMSWSQEWIRALKNSWYDLHVVTGRLDKQLDHTKHWLDMYFPDMFYDIHLWSDMTDQHISKWDLCKNIDAQLHIDDFIHYAQEIIVEDIPVLVLDCPRNNYQELKSSLITRVSDRSIITPDFVDSIIHTT